MSEPEVYETIINLIHAWAIQEKEPYAKPGKEFEARLKTSFNEAGITDEQVGLLRDEFKFISPKSNTTKEQLLRCPELIRLWKLSESGKIFVMKYSALYGLEVPDLSNFPEYPSPVCPSLVEVYREHYQVR
jgi:hypothetical protein